MRMRAATNREKEREKKAKEEEEKPITGSFFAIIAFYSLLGPQNDQIIVLNNAEIYRQEQHLEWGGIEQQKQNRKEEEERKNFLE